MLASPKMRCLRCLGYSCQTDCGVFGSLCSGGFSLCSRFRQELLEVLKKIGCGVEQGCNLSVDVLYWFRLPLICLQDLKKLLINLWLVLEAVLARLLDKVH